MFRSISSEPYCNTDLSLTQNEFVTLRVLAGSPATGRALKEIGLKEMGADLLVVNRASDRTSSLGDLFGTAVPSQNDAS